MQLLENIRNAVQGFFQRQSTEDVILERVQSAHRDFDSFSFAKRSTFALDNEPMRSGNWTLINALETPESYSAHSIWYDQTAYLERICVLLADKASAFIDEIRKIRDTNSNVLVNRLASEMIESFESQGDFKETYPYRRSTAEEERMSMKLESNIRYRPGMIWYDRLGHLEALARRYENRTAPEPVVKDIETISKHEDDWRIQELAEKMCKSISDRGNYSLALTKA